MISIDEIDKRFDNLEKHADALITLMTEKFEFLACAKYNETEVFLYSRQTFPGLCHRAAAEVRALEIVLKG